MQQLGESSGAPAAKLLVVAQSMADHGRPVACRRTDPLLEAPPPPPPNGSTVLCGAGAVGGIERALAGGSDSSASVLSRCSDSDSAWLSKVRRRACAARSACSWSMAGVGWQSDVAVRASDG